MLVLLLSESVRTSFTSSPFHQFNDFFSSVDHRLARPFFFLDQTICSTDTIGGHLFFCSCKHLSIVYYLFMQINLY
ncbi:unnamed protein product [Adineta ricciae]|uniref:Uncharacterized protein n=1 Tax=Adineta ricciae TaxID=249248 RepID=A0A814K803_ADIRI|nr:unnamed protein product [Adineta ricciae]